MVKLVSGYYANVKATGYSEQSFKSSSIFSNTVMEVSLRVPYELIVSTNGLNVKLEPCIFSNAKP